MIVWKMTATFVCPFTGMEGHPDRVETNKILFARKGRAEGLREKFLAAIRAKYKVRPDYPIEVGIEPVEVVED